jgi:magnesium-transporting ATPase (P-type)
VVQEIKAQASVESLKVFQPDIAQLIRDGVVHKIDAVQMVSGDVTEVVEGQQVRADCGIIKIKSIRPRMD